MAQQIRGLPDLDALLASGQYARSWYYVPPHDRGAPDSAMVRALLHPAASWSEILEVATQYQAVFGFLVDIGAPATGRGASRWRDVLAVKAHLENWCKLRHPVGFWSVALEVFLVCALECGCALRRRGDVIQILLPRRGFRQDQAMLASWSAARLESKAGKRRGAP